MTNPIRILIVDGKLICGGVESFIMNIYRHIDRSKVQFDFLVHYKSPCYYDKEIESLGGKVYYLTFRDDNKFFKYKKDLYSFFIQHPEYKIVWGHMDGLASIYMKIAKKCGVNVTIAHSHITNSEHNFKGFLKKILRHNLCKYTDINFACSSEAGEYLYGKHEFKLIHNAIDTSKFVFNPDIRKKIRSELKIRDDEYVIGNVGRFFPQKNHEFLIRFYADYQKNQSSSKLLLCGDGQLMPKMKKLCEELEISDNVIFCENVQNVNEMYQAMDVFVMPSLYEGLPVSGIEAQTNGLPCIFADTITKEVMLNDNQVRFLPINDSSLWCEALNQKNDRFIDSEYVVKENGYDINDLCSKLQELFLKLEKEKISIKEVKIHG